MRSRPGERYLAGGNEMSTDLFKAVVIGGVLTLWLTPQPASANRRYDPERMRFLQRDPHGDTGYTPQAEYPPHKCIFAEPTPGQPQAVPYRDGMNLYLYVGGNPISFMDPSGLKTCGKVRCNCPAALQPPASVETTIKTGKTMAGILPKRIKLHITDCCDALDESYDLDDSGLDMDNTIQHECMHICQMEYYGWMEFIMGYIREWIRCKGVHGCNVWEKQALRLDDASATPWYEWIDSPEGCSGQ